MIDKKHPGYEATKRQWGRCRDAIAGSDAIKASGQDYLPRLSEQEEGEYSSYKQRALWYGASARTLDGLSGLVFRQPVDVEGVVDEDLLASVTAKGMSLDTFARIAFRDVLCAGRYGALVDMHEGAKRAILSPYKTESIINWRTRIFQGRQQLTLIVLEESAWVPEENDVYSLKKILRWRELYLDEGGFYAVRVWRKDETSGDFQVVEESTPLIFGERIPDIPFIFFGPVHGLPDPDKPPILDIVDVNLSHYRSSADLEHGRHFTALPVYWLAGFQQDKLVVGSQEAWISERPDAQAGILEYTGQGLGALEHALESKERLMAVLGARLLEEQKKDSEAAETVRLRQAGEQSTLASVALAVSASLQECVRWMVRWSGGNEEAVSVRLNTDYFPRRLSDRELISLMQAWQGGGISWPTLYHNLQQGEIARPGIDEDEERALIDQEMAGEVMNEPVGPPA